MILILSEKYDKPTTNVIYEIEKQNGNYKTIYGSDFLEGVFSLNVNEGILCINNKVLENINIIWYRRWLNTQHVFSDDRKKHIYLKNEFEELSSNVLLNLHTKKWLNTPPFIVPYPSKAHQLKKAKDIGLRIPQTFITNCPTALESFYLHNNKNIISKNLSDPLFYNEGENYYATFTTLIENEDLKNKKTLFFPSLFQNNITKNIEIRIFYFRRQFYSYAIFSSKNKQTSVDYRLYDYKNPNRIMKYNLPRDIKTKLIKLMEDFDLDTGSIDMIKDDNNNYYFLEVNPQGQFGGLTAYDLHIERDIAGYLIRNDI